MKIRAKSGWFQEKEIDRDETPISVFRADGFKRRR
jgi:hypothetical protein